MTKKLLTPKNEDRKDRRLPNTRFLAKVAKLESLITDQGFIKSFGSKEGYSPTKPIRTLEFTHTDLGIKIVCDFAPQVNGDRFYGHTNFTTKLPKGKEKSDPFYVSFDRYGICDSFNISLEDTPAEFTTKINEQIARVKKYRDAQAFMVSVPDLPYGIHRDRISEVAEKIRKGGHLFTPAGMGTAHLLSVRPSRFATKGSEALAKFFGLPAVYITTQDYD